MIAFSTCKLENTMFLMPHVPESAAYVDASIKLDWKLINCLWWMMHASTFDKLSVVNRELKHTFSRGKKDNFVLTLWSQWDPEQSDINWGSMDWKGIRFASMFPFYKFTSSFSDFLNYVKFKCFSKGRFTHTFPAVWLPERSSQTEAWSCNVLKF